MESFLSDPDQIIWIANYLVLSVVTKKIKTPNDLLWGEGYLLILLKNDHQTLEG